MKIIWTIEFLDEAERDLKMLDRSAQLQVLKGLNSSYSLRSASIGFSRAARPAGI